MKILAITLEKCSGCAIFVDDEIIFSSSEERYTRIKSDSSFPKNSINDALEFSGMKGNDFDKVIICGNKISLIPSLINEYSTFSIDDQIRAMDEYWYPKLVLKENRSLDISELATLIKDSSFVVANDTGPAHIAAHLNSNGLALFGSHTTAYKVSIERENFKAIQVTDLNKLSPEKVFEYFIKSLN